MGKLTEVSMGYQQARRATPVGSISPRDTGCVRKSGPFFVSAHGPSVAMHVVPAQSLSIFKRVLRRAIREGSAFPSMLFSS